MKKILLIIFLFLCFTKVEAQERTFASAERLEGISYMKNNWKEIQYRNALVIRDVVTGEIAYCIEPFKLLINNSDYIINDGNNFGISPDIWDRIQLLSYYGYGYKNHTDKKWISITQMSIWRMIFPSYQFDWINNITDRVIIYPYNNELNELNELINSHYVLPNLKKEYIMGIEDELILYDSNNVLDNYSIESSDFDAFIEDNKLVIKSDSDEKEGTIKIQRASEVFPETVKFFYSSESQSLMERGNITPVKTEIKVKVKKGKIIINKIDSETKDFTPQGEASLIGASFQIFDEKNELFEEKVLVDSTLEFDYLPFGKYYLKEKYPGVGYYLNDKVYEIVIDENNINNEIDFENFAIKSNIKIIKLYGTEEDYNRGTMEKEEGIIFRIYNKDEELVFEGETDSEGVIEVKLPYGSYSLEQVNTTEGYEKNEIHYFTIDDDNSFSQEIVLNDLKIYVPNASVSFFDSLINYFRKLLYV